MSRRGNQSCCVVTMFLFCLVPEISIFWEEREDLKLIVNTAL